MEDSFTPPGASYCLPDLIWQRSLNLDAWLIYPKCELWHSFLKIPPLWHPYDNLVLCSHLYDGILLTNANKTYYEYLLGDAPAASPVLYIPFMLSHWSWIPEGYFHLTRSWPSPVHHLCSRCPHNLVANRQWGKGRDPSKQGHPKVPKQLTGARRGIKNIQSTQSDSHPLSALLSMELPHFNITN